MTKFVTPGFIHQHILYYRNKPHLLPIKMIETSSVRVLAIKSVHAVNNGSRDEPTTCEED